MAVSQSTDGVYLPQDAQSVGVAQSTLPTLNSDDGLIGLDDAHVECGLQSESVKEDNYQDLLELISETSVRT